VPPAPVGAAPVDAAPVDAAPVDAAPSAALVEDVPAERAKEPVVKADKRKRPRDRAREKERASDRKEAHEAEPASPVRAPSPSPVAPSPAPTRTEEKPTATVSIDDAWARLSRCANPCGKRVLGTSSLAALKADAAKRRAFLTFSAQCLLSCP
jgi:hypothetical protein